MTRTLLFFALCLGGALHAAPNTRQPMTSDIPPMQLPGGEGEVSLTTLDRLIAATEQTLSAEKQIRQMVVEYSATKVQHLQNRQSRERIVRMVKMAKSLLDAIQTNYLSDAFDTEFMQELSFFAQIASKKTLPKP